MQARVMSVSYDSGVRGNLDFDTIGTLLAGAAGLYNVGQGRPLVLVGHSLGGLVLKRMCVTAWERGEVDPKMKALAESGARMHTCECVRGAAGM
jgi:surfactin synthase thioesterase subunit